MVWTKTSKSENNSRSRAEQPQRQLSFQVWEVLRDTSTPNLFNHRHLCFKNISTHLYFPLPYGWIKFTFYPPDPKEKTIPPVLVGPSFQEHRFIWLFPPSLPPAQWWSLHINPEQPSTGTSPFLIPWSESHLLCFLCSSFLPFVG